MADVWVSSVTGNNANNGLSSGAPKATIAAALTAMGGSGVLRAERNSVFNHAFSTMPFAGFRMEAYGTGNQPIVNGGSAAQTVNYDKIGSFDNIEFRGLNRLFTVNVLGACHVHQCKFFNAGAGGANGQSTIFVVNCGGGVGSFHLEQCWIWDNLSDADHIFVQFCAGSVSVRALRVTLCHFRNPGGGFGDHMHIFQNTARNIEFAFNHCEPVATGKGHILCGGLTQDLNVHDNFFDGGNYVMGWETCADYEFYNNFCINVGPDSWSGANRFATPAGQGGRTGIANIHDNIYVNCRNSVHSYDHNAAGSNIQITFEHNTIVDPVGPNSRWLEFGTGANLTGSVVRHNLIRSSAPAIISVGGVTVDDNWFENTATTGTNPKTGNAGLNTEFFPTNPAAATLPYGARQGFTPPGNRPPPPSNTITGTSGADILTAPVLAAGTLLDGLGGNDIYVMQPGQGPSEVAWFTRNPPVEQDLLNVAAFGWSSFAAFQAAVTLEPVPGGTYGDVPWDVLIIHFNASDKVWLNSVLNIQASEVILAAPPGPGGQPSASRRRHIFTHGPEGVG